MSPREVTGGRAGDQGVKMWCLRSSGGVIQNHGRRSHRCAPRLKDRQLQVLAGTRTETVHPFGKSFSSLLRRPTSISIPHQLCPWRYPRAAAGPPRC